MRWLWVAIVCLVSGEGCALLRPRLPKSQATIRRLPEPVFFSEERIEIQSQKQVVTSSLELSHPAEPTAPGEDGEVSLSPRDERDQPSETMQSPSHQPSSCFEVSVEWDGDADIDLRVIEPNGFAVDLVEPISPNGALFEHDARGACAYPHLKKERITWHQPPPPGEYRVQLLYADGCGVGKSQEVRLRLTKPERTIEYRLSLAPGRKVDALVFPINSPSDACPVNP
ncbi:MAG: hypothetical protein NZM37_07545 [Sandaracinaceae bacterium]|nr:hypothetical protein [Sandaracinaceae bacterium]MDW8246339.1 hypothetical protein [Sandaracinaceae bacterium]